MYIYIYTYIYIIYTYECDRAVHYPGTHPLNERSL